MRGIEALAVPSGSGVASENRLRHGAGVSEREQDSDHRQTTIGLGVDHVKLGGEALAVYQVLRGRVKVHRLQLEFSTSEHGNVAGGVVGVDLPAVIAEGCLGGGVRESDGAEAASLVAGDVDGGLLFAVGAGGEVGGEGGPVLGGGWALVAPFDERIIAAAR